MDELSSPELNLLMQGLGTNEGLNFVTHNTNTSVIGCIQLQVGRGALHSR